MTTGLLLDTVVVSELRKGRRADPAVIDWQAKTTGLPTYLSVITLLEIRLGILRVQLRDAAFASRLQAWYDGHLLPRFRDTLLPVTQAVAESAAELSAARQLSPHDALIAATAHAHGLTLVTRNVSDFTGIAVPVVNPWEPNV